MKQNTQYHRILLKLSGEAFLGNEKFGIDPKTLSAIATQLHELLKIGVEVGLVIGGGNIFRGAELIRSGLEQTTGDQMGMLATVMNALALQDECRRQHIPVKVMSAFPIEGVVSPFDQTRAVRLLAEKQLLIFAGGTGHPYFTTDTAAALRGLQIKADILLKATKVDGIYSADPKKDPNAKHYKILTYQDVIEKQLKVMDLTSICLCRDNKMPVCVFNMNEPNVLKRIVSGEAVGTLVKE